MMYVHSTIPDPEQWIPEYKLGFDAGSGRFCIHCGNRIVAWVSEAGSKELTGYATAAFSAQSHPQRR